MGQAQAADQWDPMEVEEELEPEPEPELVEVEPVGVELELLEVVVQVVHQNNLVATSNSILRRNKKIGCYRVHRRSCQERKVGRAMDLEAQVLWGMVDSFLAL